MNGRKLLNFCQLNGLRIANGRLGSDKSVGKYTYVVKNGRSVIDYAIVNPYLLDGICNFHVDDPNILSDHCMIQFSIPCKTTHEKATSGEKATFDKVKKKYVWHEERSNEYIFNLEAEENVRGLQAELSNLSTTQDKDKNILSFNLLLENVCDPLFSKKIYTQNVITKNEGSDLAQPWFDDECRDYRKRFYFALDTYRSDKSPLNQTHLASARSDYKRILRKKRFCFAKEKTSKLTVSKSKNVKEYWNLLKEAANLKHKCSVAASKFSEYFQAVSDPNDR